MSFFFVTRIKDKSKALQVEEIDFLTHLHLWASVETQEVYLVVKGEVEGRDWFGFKF